MATLVYMKNLSNNLMGKAYVGFSWTSLLFGPFPLLFRNEWGFFLILVAVHILLAVVSFGIGNFILGLVWAFYFNKWHMRRLIERGYLIDESQTESLVAEAKAQAGVIR